jgi:predicted transcriptional regulator YdeE
VIANIELTHLPEFYLCGIEVRTTNQNGQSQKDIGGLWQRFMTNELLRQITSRVSDDIYCVYTGYETDYTGFYTTVLGCKISTPDQVPEGFTGLTIPAAKYEVYLLAGKFPENVHQAWQEIWTGDSNRAYTTDFDLYSANAKSFAETEVKIYLAIK